MAEAIFYRTAVRFLGSLASKSLQEIASAWNVKKDLKKLEATLSTIRSVLLDAEQQQEKNNEVKDWLGKLKHAFYEVDDLIDDFATEALGQNPRKNKNSKVKEVRDFFSTSKNQIAFSLKISHKIKAVRDELDEIASDRSKFHFKERLEERPLKIRETHSFVPPSKVIGRDEDKRAILELVMDDGGSQENVSIIPIVGIGGLGKTTLAQLVYNDEKVTTRFDLKMWVCVSDVFDVKMLIKKIIKSANKECGNLEMDQLQNLLRTCLNGKRYILVLDDVWNDDREKWIKLEELLKDGARGSKIVVTTRSEKVALIMGNASAAYHLKGLSEDDCWSLFKQLAFKQGHLENPSLLRIGKEILKKCVGVPLAIRTVGSLLYLEDSEAEWLIVKDKLWELAQDENHMLPTLKVSYDHLPYNLKQCFAYCSLFQKDSIIYKKTLIQLWMAQGFIQPELEGKDYSLEDIGDQYFKDLLFRSFFQDIEKDDYGYIISCKMHDLVHDLAQSIAGMEYCSITNNDAENISERTYHVSVISDRGLWEVPTPLLKAKKARTFFLLSSRTLMTRSALDLLITSFMCLRVLDLHNTRIGNVPSSTGKLKHLRYLDLSFNEMTTLPLSICKLQNLQTLKLSDCLKLRELPIDIRKLISLRHLEIDGCHQLTHMPFGLGELTSLRTLPLFVVGEDTKISNSVGGIGELNSLNHLRGTFRITGLESMRHDTSGSTKLRKANLKAKRYLQVLALEWDPDDDGAEDADANTAVLEDLQPHPNLKQLDIVKYGGIRFPVWMTVNLVSSLPNLVHITLADCGKCQHLPWFGQLHFLKVLELRHLHSLEYIHNNSVESSSSHPSSSWRVNVVSSAKEWSFFPSLKVLYLHDLPILKEWSREVVIANDDMEIAPAPHKVSLLSFPCLTDLDIDDCPTLISVPWLPSLENLSMRYTSEKLLQAMTRVIETDSHITTIDSSIPPSPLPSLKTLHICYCEDLVSLPEEALQNLTSLQHLSITGCHKLVHLPEEGLRGLTSLQSLSIIYCESLTSISLSRDLTALQRLEISGCYALNWSEEENGLQVLRSLQSLYISVLPKLVSLPHGLQHLTTLQDLGIEECDGLVTFPEWIGNLASLRRLYIRKCDKLESLPDAVRCLTALEELTISFCGILSKRCQRERGTEWPKIAHIPKICIDCKWIQWSTC